MKIVNWLKPDKSLHIMISTALVVLFFGIFKSIFIATIITMLLGLIKEFVWDKYLKNGTYSNQDLLADFIGTIIGICYCAYCWLMIGFF